MRKFTALGITFLIVILTSLSSCDKEDEVNPIVGTWEYSETVEDFTVTITLIFNSDNTGSTKVAYVMGDLSDEESSSFTYNTSGNTLSVTIDGETSSSTYSVKENTLTITEDGESIVFTRKF